MKAAAQLTKEKRFVPRKKNNTALQQTQHLLYIKENVIKQLLHSVLLHKGKFYQRLSGSSLSFIFYSGNLVQGNLYGSYVCFFSQYHLWTASSFSLSGLFGTRSIKPRACGRGKLFHQTFLSTAISISISSH